MSNPYPRLGSDELLEWQELFWSPSSVIANGGVITGFVPANINRGLVCDATNKRISYGGAFGRLGPRYTVLCEVTPQVANLYNTVVARSASALLNEFDIGVRNTGAMFVGTPAGYTETGAGVIANGERAQLAWVNAGVGSTLTTYKNGALVFNWPAGGNMTTYAAAPLTIAHRAYAANEQYWNGTIWQVRIYARALSIADLLAIYAAREGW